MKKMHRNLMLVLVTVIWGGGFIATSAAVGDIQPHFYILMIRFVGSALLSFVVAAKAIKEIKASTLRKGIVAGDLLVSRLCFSDVRPAGEHGKHQRLSDIHECHFRSVYQLGDLSARPTMRQILASLLCVIGISLLTLKGDAFSFGKGEFYSLMCAVFFAAHIIALDWGTKGENALAINALQMLTAGILSTACALFFDAPPRSVDMSAVLSALYLIAVSTCLAFLLQTAAQKYTSASSASLILSMESLFACIFSFLLLHEQITVMMIAGGALILASIVVVEYHPSSASIQQKSTETAG